MTPRQMRGIELNARAAAIADLVLWIGYLQWHRRRYGESQPLPEPVLEGYGQVEHRDAVLSDDGAPAPWPEADFIVGNPPFLGKGEPMRNALGQEYLDALAEAYPDVPGSADFVVYWWHRAAEAVRRGRRRAVRTRHDQLALHDVQPARGRAAPGLVPGLTWNER